MRFDDIQGLDWQGVELGTQCLKLPLLRSKTTGPGNKTKTVDIFIHRGCSLSGADWLEAGLELLKRTDFERDFFLPVLEEDGSFRRRMLDYSRGASLPRSLLRSFRYPGQEEAIRFLAKDSTPLPGEMGNLWSGHSERHLLPSVTAAQGEPKERRDYLGRWGIDRAASSDYVLSLNDLMGI